MRRLACLFFCVLAAPAGAKEVTRAAVCGADRCVRIAPGQDLFPQSAAAAPTSARGFVRLTLTIQPEDFKLRMAVVGDAARGDDGQWSMLSPSGMARVRRAARRVQPLPAARLRLAAATPAPRPARPSAESGGGFDPLPFAIAAALALLAAGTVSVRRRGAA